MSKFSILFLVLLCSELFVKDSVYDINNDGKNDFIVKYQSTNGFVTFVYLFDKKHNLLITKPDTLHNFTPIDKKSFFQIYRNFFTPIFEKYTWSGTNIIHDKTYLVDYHSEYLDYFQIVNEDTIKLRPIQIPEQERAIIEKNNF